VPTFDSRPLQEWQKEQARLREKLLSGKSDKKQKKKDKKKDKKNDKKKDKKKEKKAKKRSSESDSEDSDSDSDSGSDHRSKKSKKSRKEKKEKKESSKEILPTRKSDDALVKILKEGSSAGEVKTLLSMIDDRQAVLVGGVPSGPRKHLEAFFASLGMKGKAVSGGPAYLSAACSGVGVKLTRHYSHVLELYKRKQAKGETQRDPIPAAPTAPAAPVEPVPAPEEVLPLPPTVGPEHSFSRALCCRSVCCRQPLFSSSLC